MQEISFAMKLLEGKKIAEKILEEVKKEAAGKKLKLVVVLVGEDLASRVFVKEKEKACKKIGIGFELFTYSESVSQEELQGKIEEIAKKEDVSGVVVQLPLPKSFSTQEVLDLIPFRKDPDLLSFEGFNNFALDKISILPPVVGAVAEILKEYGFSVSEKNVVLVGEGRLVGKPLKVWLEKKGADVFLAKEDEKNIPEKVDFLISGAGKPGLIGRSEDYNIDRETIVIDAGSSLQGKGLVGDVDFKSVSKKAGFVTPVPGGVGPLTVAVLLRNLVELSK